MVEIGEWGSFIISDNLSQPVVSEILKFHVPLRVYFTRWYLMIQIAKHLGINYITKWHSKAFSYTVFSFSYVTNSHQENAL